MPHVGPQIRLCNGANGSPVMPAQAARSRKESPEPPTSLMPEIFPFFLMAINGELDGDLSLFHLRVFRNCVVPILADVGPRQALSTDRSLRLECH
jgi:hypothetical protein